MIERRLNPDTDLGLLVLRPNRSMSWTGNRRCMLALSVVTLGLAGLFAARGLWPILAVALVHISWVWLALYKVSLDCQRRECIRFTEAEIVVLRGRYHPHQELRFPRSWTRMVLRRGPSPAYPSRLFLRCYGRETELGTYLVEEERQHLARDLRAYLPNLPAIAET